MMPPPLVVGAENEPPFRLTAPRSKELVGFTAVPLNVIARIAAHAMDALPTETVATEELLATV